MTQAWALSCEQCGLPVAMGTLVCPRCGGFVYRRRLEQLAAEALRNEPANPALAAHFWRQSLLLLPANSPQYQNVAQRSAALEYYNNGAQAATRRAYVQPEPADDETPAIRPPDSLPRAAFKTLASMLVSIILYMLVLGGMLESANDRIIFAVGFTTLMLIHELGHSIALRRFRLSASPPIFIPFLGAVINMRQPPRNATEEAVVGIAGPLLGTVGTVACAGLMLTPWANLSSSNHEVIGAVAFVGVILNLFNLLPVPPLDGGRVTAALNPWIWVLGLAGLFGLVWYTGTGQFMATLILIFGLPRIIQTLRRRSSQNPYYDVKRRDAWAIGTIYIVLAVLLTGMFFALKGYNPFDQLT